MYIDLTEQHSRFRELVAPDVKYRMKHHPVFTEYDWVMRCYFSILEYEAKFPDPFKREEYLRTRAELKEMNDDIARKISHIDFSPFFRN